MHDESRRLDTPRNVRPLRHALIVVLALSVLAQLIVHLHPHFAIESIFAFHAWFGFGACAVIVIVAKGVSMLLGRDASYLRRTR